MFSSVPEKFKLVYHQSFEIAPHSIKVDGTRRIWAKLLNGKIVVVSPDLSKVEFLSAPTRFSDVVWDADHAFCVSHDFEVARITYSNRNFELLYNYKGIVRLSKSFATDGIGVLCDRLISGFHSSPKPVATFESSDSPFSCISVTDESVFVGSCTPCLVNLLTGDCEYLGQMREWPIYDVAINRKLEILMLAGLNELLLYTLSRELIESIPCDSCLRVMAPNDDWTLISERADAENKRPEIVPLANSVLPIFSIRNCDPFDVIFTERRTLVYAWQGSELFVFEAIS